MLLRSQTADARGGVTATGPRSTCERDRASSVSAASSMVKAQKVREKKQADKRKEGNVGKKKLAFRAGSPADIRLAVQTAHLAVQSLILLVGAVIMLAIALSLLGAEPSAGHPAEHPGEDYAARSVREEGAVLVLRHSHVSFFNTAYTWNAAARTWVGITRPMANPTQAALCGVSFGTTVPVNTLAIVPDARQDAYTALDMLPAAHRCQGIGEPKLVTIGGARFVYGHTHKHGPDAFFNYMSAHGVDTPGRRQMFLASVYRNFLAPLALPGGKMGTVTPLRPLFWDERPEPQKTLCSLRVSRRHASLRKCMGACMRCRTPTSSRSCSLSPTTRSTASTRPV